MPRSDFLYSNLSITHIATLTETLQVSIIMKIVQGRAEWHFTGGAL